MSAAAPGIVDAVFLLNSGLATNGGSLRGALPLPAPWAKAAVIDKVDAMPRSTAKTRCAQSIRFMPHLSSETVPGCNGLWDMKEQSARTSTIDSACRLCGTVDVRASNGV